VGTFGYGGEDVFDAVGTQALGQVSTHRDHTSLTYLPGRARRYGRLLRGAFEREQSAAVVGTRRARINSLTRAWNVSDGPLLFGARLVPLCAQPQPSRTARSNRRRRSGSTIALISTILPPETVKPMTATGCPPTVTTTPAAPFTSTGRFGADTCDHERRTGSGCRAVEHNGSIRVRLSSVDSHHDVWVEDRDERMEVTVLRRGEEGVDHFSLAGDIGVWGLDVGSSYAAPGPAGELPRRGRGT
jgi:hypothetical protein